MQASESKPFLNRLANKLFVVGFALVLLTGVIVAVVGSRLARQAILGEAEARILAIVEQREIHLTDWLDLYIHTARTALRPSEILANPAETWGERVKEVPGLLSVTVLSSSGEILSVISVEEGESIYLPLDSTAVRAAMLSREVSFGAVRLSKNDSAFFDLVIPAEDSAKTLQVHRISSREILNPIVGDTTGLGEGVELFLLDRDMRMLTPSRFHGHPAPLKHRMVIPPATAALETPRGSMEYTSFLGQPVVGGYIYMPHQRWILVGEMSVEGALKPIERIYARATAVMIVVLLILLVLTRNLARSWSRPIERLTHASEQVAAGDYSIEVPGTRSSDEIGRLTQSFNRMVKALHDGEEDLESAQREIVKQEKIAEIGKLVTSIVHEMRNPLSSVKMNLRLLERSKCDDPVEQEHLDLASGDVRRLEAMLQELLVYGKPIETNIVAINPVPILRAAVEDKLPYASEQGVRLEVLSREVDETVQADPELLRRSLDNLIGNAIEACEEGDHVEVSLDIEKRDALIQVVDSGKGMNEIVRQKLFDPFFTTREHGTGLGMSNVRKFVEAMNGSIYVTSNEGRGTTITIRVRRTD